MESDVDHRRRPVEPQVERRHHAFHQMDDRGGVESEHDRLDSSVSLDVRAARTVGHHLGDRRIGEQRFEGTGDRWSGSVSRHAERHG
jgi:hypothetical protein